MLIKRREYWARQPAYPVAVDRNKAAQAGAIYLALANEPRVLRDLIGGANLVNPGGADVAKGGRVWTFNGSQQGVMSYALPNGETFPGNILIGARVLASSAQASTPGHAFGLSVSSGTQSAIGVGFDSTGTKVGVSELTGNGAYLNTYSPCSLNRFYDVFLNITSSGSVRAWIDGAPAVTGQSSSTTTGWNFSGWNEICVGAQHRSAGFLRQFKGAIQWASLIHVTDPALITDDLVGGLYDQGYPYNLLKPRRRFAFFLGVGGGSSISLTIADAVHAHTSDSLGLSVADYLAIADSTHTHASDNIVLDTSSAANLTISDAQHAHSAESLTLVTDSLLSIADSVHAHQSGNLSLSSAVFLAIADAVHAHLSDNVTLDTSNSITLTVQDSAHGHTSESLGLTLDTWLQIVDSLHAHLSDSVVLSAEETLSIANALHAHFSAVPTLILGGAVVYARAPAGRGPRILAAPGRRPANTQTQSRPVNTGGTRH